MAKTKAPRKNAHRAQRAPPKKPRQARRAPKETEAAAPKVLPLEIEPGTVEQTLKNLREEVGHWVKKGRYTKVRFKVRGKPVLPDIPIAAVMAAEAMTFWWGGLLRALLMNLGAKAVLDVELVSEAEKEVARGRALVLAGDLDAAIAAFRLAIDMDRDYAPGWLNLGIAQKLKGDLAAAREALQKAEQLDAQGPAGEEARKVLDQFPPG